MRAERLITELRLHLQGDKTTGTAQLHNPAGLPLLDEGVTRDGRMGTDVITGSLDDQLLVNIYLKGHGFSLYLSSERLNLA
jgi:hypothetical protein